MNDDLKILAIDTATDYLGVALLQGDVIASEITLFAPKKHSEILPEILDFILEKNDMKISDDIIIAISIGPGSYTGLRVGISFVQGLSVSKGLKIVAVDTLRAIAFRFAPNYIPVAVALDARAGGIYAALYDIVGKPSPIIESNVFGLAELSYELSSRDKILFVGNETIYNKMLSEVNGTSLIYAGEPKPSAGMVAKLAIFEVNSGRFLEPELLEPKYLRQFKAGKRKRKPIL